MKVTVPSAHNPSVPAAQARWSQPWRSIAFIFLIATVTVVGAAKAAPPTNPNNSYYYRVDTRPPADILTNGFYPLGSNRNVLDHMKGISCVSQLANSAFISGTDDPVWAANYARRLQSPGNPTVYVYIMRRTLDWYDAARSAEFAATHGWTAYRTVVNPARQQHEWLNDGHVAVGEIMGYRAFDNLDPNYTPPIIPNHNYVDIAPQINGGVLDLGAFDALPGPNRYVAALPVVDACMAATNHCLSQSSSQRNAIASAGCAAPEHIFSRSVGVGPSMGLLSQ
jgi:hypothetical protein